MPRGPTVPTTRFLFGSGIGVTVPIRPSLTPARTQIFDSEMQSFFSLFNRYLTERAKSEKL
jgi:hypothetical protein